MTAGRGRTGGGVSTRRRKKMQAAGYPAMNAAAPFAQRRPFDWKWVVIGLCVVFTIYIAVVQFAVGASLFAFLLGTALAWMNERTNTPFKTLFFALSIIPLIIPGILFTVAW